MAPSDFPAWYSAGIFGGIGCALLSAVTIAAWALWRRRGVTGQVIWALLVCAVASALDMGPLLWIEYRLNVYGPTLHVGEVGLALAATAVIGWAIPLATLCWYLLLARTVAAAPLPAVRGGVTPAALDDPDRARSAFADGKPWGALTPVATSAPVDTAMAAPLRVVPLTQRLILIGREMDNDIVLDDERISRRHAEMRWDHGRVELADYGSLNGSLVNEQAVRGRLLLHSGDIVQLGKRRYQLALRPAESAAASDQRLELLETRKTSRISDATAVGRPALRVVALQGVSVGSSWPLSAAAMTIGRETACDIVLPDTSTSRVHAQITRQLAGYFIADLESSNGVWLNGQRLTGPAQIVAGDVITVGDNLLRCEEIVADAVSVSEEPSALANSSAAETSTASTASMLPTGAPEFYMRIASVWNEGNQNRPRLAPPRLRPAAPQRDPSAE
jgi:pSer/pThr/pTyr-binding forkhead associated (FHA) protein